MKTTVQLYFSVVASLSLLACSGDGNVESEVVLEEVISTVSEETRSPIISCGRACLNDFVDQYLSALVANDPNLGPFADDVKFTENAQILELGDALWGTASAGPTNYKLIAADPETATAAFFIIMEESGTPIWLTGRLTVANQQITELETVIIRSGGGFSGFDHDAPEAIWSEIVPPEERATREELFTAADSYMEALEQNLVDHVEFDASCNRIENGVITANDPNVETGMGAMTCQENINSGMWVYIQEISPRRFLVADEELGIVMGVFMFHQDGSDEFAMVNGEKVMYSGATRRPFTTVIPEMFKVKDGKIHRIVATMASIPYKSKSGWEDDGQQ